MITRFKFHGATDLADALAARLADAVRAAKAAAPGEPMPGLVLPVPLSAQRLRERGYNQAWELARRVAKRLGLKASPRALLRVADTSPQVGLNLGERHANLRHAFLVDPLHRAMVAGQRLALVDDVMTTGATVEALARVLKQAGAVHVEAWALARTPAPD